MHNKPWLAGILMLWACAGLAGAASRPAAAAGAPVSADLARFQMHRDTLRGVVYRPRTPSAGSEPATIRMRVLHAFDLGGDPETNVRANVYPIDPDGRGHYHLLFFDGYRVMKLLTADGAVRWSIGNDGGRIHRSPYHRDSIVVLDVDGDGKQEIIHCWAKAGEATRSIQVRRGDTGALIRSVRLSGSSSRDECQLAAFYMTGRRTPLILVARTAQPGARCQNGIVDTWSRTTAFTTDLAEAWDRSTCDAGHYVWPVDQDRDGFAEAVYVGKYLYDAAGRRLCTLAGWDSNHVDSMVFGNFAPQWSQQEVLAVGANGTRFYSAANCVLRWTIGTGSIPNPQVATAAWLDGADARSQLFVQEKAPGETVRRMYSVSSTGRIVSSYLETTKPTKGQYQTANIDGATAKEDRVGAYGQVIAESGAIRLRTDWYWNLQNLTAAEERLLDEEKWAFNPLVFDRNRNGVDEIITWGRHRLVIGEAQ